MRNAKHSDPVPCQVELRTSSYIDPDRLDQDDSLDQDHLSNSYRESDEFSMDDRSPVVNSGGAMDTDDDVYENTQFPDLQNIYQNEQIGAAYR